MLPYGSLQVLFLQANTKARDEGKHKANCVYILLDSISFKKNLLPFNTELAW